MDDASRQTRSRTFRQEEQSTFHRVHDDLTSRSLAPPPATLHSHGHYRQDSHQHASHSRHCQSPLGHDIPLALGGRQYVFRQAT